jgi:hypothetical protein
VIHYVATNKNQIGVLGVHQIDPSMELSPSIDIAKMQIGHHHNFQRVFQWLTGFDSQRYAPLRIVIEISIGENQNYDSWNHNTHVTTAEHPFVRDDVAAPSDVEQKEENSQIKHNEHP